MILENAFEIGAKIDQRVVDIMGINPPPNV